MKVTLEYNPNTKISTLHNFEVGNQFVSATNDTNIDMELVLAFRNRNSIKFPLKAKTTIKEPIEDYEYVILSNENGLANEIIKIVISVE